MSQLIAWALLFLIGGTVLYVVIMNVFVAALKPFFQKNNNSQ